MKWLCPVSSSDAVIHGVFGRGCKEVHGKITLYFKANKFGSRMNQRNENGIKPFHSGLPVYNWSKMVTEFNQDF